MGALHGRPRGTEGRAARKPRKESLAFDALVMRKSLSSRGFAATDIFVSVTFSATRTGHSLCPGASRGDAQFWRFEGRNFEALLRVPAKIHEGLFWTPRGPAFFVGRGVFRGHHGGLEGGFPGKDRKRESQLQPLDLNPFYRGLTNTRGGVLDFFPGSCSRARGPGARARGDLPEVDSMLSGTNQELCLRLCQSPQGLAASASRGPPAAASCVEAS